MQIQDCLESIKGVDNVHYKMTRQFAAFQINVAASPTIAQHTIDITNIRGVVFSILRLFYKNKKIRKVSVNIV
jgi:hypothetical protein